jgi:DMSO/TMAO reductase YedYZ molybdopterin-dependent catalytic subunit
LIGVGARAELSASVLRTLVPSLADVKAGGATYRGIGLGDVLLKSGLRAAAMEDKRELAPSVVVATGSDGYTAVFSVAELLAPGAAVLLAFESDGKPLGPESGPFQIVDTATPMRSVRNLSSLELRTLAVNTRDEPAQ